MQIFVRTLGGSTVALESDINDTIGALQEQLKSSSLDRDVSLSHYCSAQGLRKGSTLTETARLKGGKPVKVDIITSTNGQSVMIDVESGSSMLVVKQQLEQATGVPVQFQKVMLAGIGQMVMADKRSNIGFTHCGSTDNFYFATLGTGSSK
ncbi:MAG: hypothetical protein WDW36_003101 [Sanguina aurantia]